MDMHFPLKSSYLYVGMSALSRHFSQKTIGERKTSPRRPAWNDGRHMSASFKTAFCSLDFIAISFQHSMQVLRGEVKVLRGLLSHKSLFPFQEALSKNGGDYSVAHRKFKAMLQGFWVFKRNTPGLISQMTRRQRAAELQQFRRFCAEMAAPLAPRRALTTFQVPRVPTALDLELCARKFQWKITL